VGLNTDWVPCTGYGERRTLANGTTLVFPLYDLPAIAESHDEFEEQSSLFILRIVGTIGVGHLTGAGGPPVDTVNPWMWRIMPLQADLTVPTVDLPWDPAVNNMREGVDAGPIANLRFWDERIGEDIGDSTANVNNLSPVDHPYWSHVDIRPKQRFGLKLNLWPCIVFQNTSANDFTIFRLWLRLLVSR